MERRAAHGSRFAPISRCVGEALVHGWQIFFCLSITKVINKASDVLRALRIQGQGGTSDGGFSG
jgi:hypothetical protein